jgi:hypothetical protein
VVVVAVAWVAAVVAVVVVAAAGVADDVTLPQLSDSACARLAFLLLHSRQSLLLLPIR